MDVGPSPVQSESLVPQLQWGLQNVASMIEAKWNTPLGLAEVVSESALELRNDLDILELDSFSHSKEHSIEVQIPMLQETFSHEMKI